MATPKKISRRNLGVVYYNMAVASTSDSGVLTEELRAVMDELKVHKCVTVESCHKELVQLKIK